VKNQNIYSNYLKFDAFVKLYKLVFSKLNILEKEVVLCQFGNALSADTNMMKKKRGKSSQNYLILGHALCAVPKNPHL